MTDTPASPDSHPDLPPPPKPRNRWKVVAIVLAVLIAAFVVLVIIGSRAGDDRDTKLSQLLPSSIEKNFRDKGIDVTVESVSCEKLPTTDTTFSIMCDVRIAGIDEIVESTVQGEVSDEFVTVDEVFSEERLLNVPKAIEYVQVLVDQLTAGVAVLDCELGGDVVVIRAGSEFSCNLDSGETVLITVAADGSGQITDVFQTQQ